MTKTIITLPETTQTTLCLQLTGTVTAQDFTEFFDTPVRHMADTYNYYNLCVHYDEKFEGWSREAADLSFKCISQYSPKARRLAYVNAPDSRMLMMKMLEPIMKAEIKYFDEDARTEAIAWVLSSEQSDEKRA